MEDNNYNEENGLHIKVNAGDIVDTGEGPPTTIAIPGAMWVPRGTIVNGQPIDSNSKYKVSG